MRKVSQISHRVKEILIRKTWSLNFIPEKSSAWHEFTKRQQIKQKTFVELSIFNVTRFVGNKWERRMTDCAITWISIWIPNVCFHHWWSSQQIETSRTKSANELKKLIKVNNKEFKTFLSFWRLHLGQIEKKRSSLTSFHGSKDREGPKKYGKFCYHKEWKLFKCRLRNVNTIYQDFHTEIIIMSICERSFCCLLTFFSFSLVSSDENKKEKGQKFEGRTWDGKIIIISIIPNGFVHSAIRLSISRAAARCR